MRDGTTKLRHAVVTHMMSLPESESLKMRESLSLLMRHSLKHQQLTYCDISRQDRTLISRNLLNRSVEQAASNVQQTDQSDNEAAASNVKQSEDKGERSVIVGDIFALVDGSTTCLADASIFLGKVMRLEEDGEEVLLMELRNVPGEDSLFRAVPDSCWHESKNSLIFPVDVAWDKSCRAYHLRSTVEELYGCLNN